MRCIEREHTDPYFNIAAEEHCLREFSDDIFMLWRNAPCIIVGKHQNTLAEINVAYVEQHNIPVVRRITGGGTVFHDLGNINFTFIRNGQTDELVDFRGFTKPIVEVLQKIGVDARFEGRNDLTIEGKKFSGNAEHVYKNRVLHHGTLLFSSQLTDLSSALKVDPHKFTDKAVKSVRSRVTNIASHLKEPMDVLAFKNLVLEHIRQTHPEMEITRFSEDDIYKINQLADQKYRTREWNYGYVPRYNFQRKLKASGGNIEFNLEVKNGIIEKIKIFGDYFSLHDTTDIEHLLENVPHDRQAIMHRLQDTNLQHYFKNVTTEEFLDGMF
ncbi:lipoate--protein ligase [Candidatus Falkowbacteria bacterium]|nr:lipoate--protein ligase [Candidatus Falkowbacteria bacterium]